MGWGCSRQPVVETSLDRDRVFRPRYDDNECTFILLRTRSHVKPLTHWLARIFDALVKPDEEYDVIFVKYFKHWRTGRIIYAKNGKSIPIRVHRKK